MTRMYLRLGAALILLVVVAGCLINGPESSPPYYSYLRIQPDYRLEAAPEGTCYEIWVFDLDSTFQDIKFKPLMRFQWDPVNYRTLNLNGEQIPLYDPEGPGMDMGENVVGHVLVGITVEPINDPLPTIPQGPVIAFYLDLAAIIPQLEIPSPLRQNKEAELRLDGQGGVPPASGLASVSMMAQSLQNRRQKAGENVCWRDETSGQGLWFVEPTVVNKIVEDTAGYTADPDADSGDGTIYTRNVDLNGDSRQYIIWVFPDHPESSWSNFDNVFPTQIPDLRFRDGAPIRPTGIQPPPSSGYNKLGSHPMVRNGKTIGYMYFPDTSTAPDFTDTCFLRVDYPESTYCTNHPDTVYYRDGNLKEFDDVNYLVREFTTTWGDTLTTPALTNLPLLPNDQIGLDWEAWVIFDSVNNPTYPPLSLGRISGGDRNFDGNPDGPYQRDSGDPYTDNANFDPNIHYPGEDFLQGLPAPFPSPLDLNTFAGANQLKIWITAEPAYDWDSTRPYTQLIGFAGYLQRETQAGLNAARQLCAERGQPQAGSPPAVLTSLLGWRPLGLTRTDLVEGHNWPVIKIFVTDATEAAKMQ